jgi:TolB-like protein/cytochrome c-type biogenesis protein CcmH/NrfG
MTESRQLAAIMFTDIVGFTALMGKDESRTMELIDKNRLIHKPIVSSYNGRWIKELGDGVMLSFNTASDAVRAAIKIMEECHAANEYQLCIGIHSAEVMFVGDDVFGDGVNIAARVQGAAQAGCIYVTDAVRRSISNKPDIQTRFVQTKQLKNVREPIKLYQVLYEGGEIARAEKPTDRSAEKSIAVLPFVNMSSDPEQEYFSDGISEEIINLLAQVEELKVIGRTSSFAFKGMNMDLKVIGEQLDVNHLLEGSVRKGGNKLRITAQLIEVNSGFHLYSEKFDRELEDVFAIQDEIAEAILNATKIRLFGEEKVTVSEAYSDNIEAYKLYLKGRFHVHKFTPDGFYKAIEYFDAAIALEPNYAIAYAGLSFSYSSLKDFNWTFDKELIPLAKQTAWKSLELDDKIAESHLAVGRILLHQEWKIKEAHSNFKKALAINPNSAEIHVQIAFCLTLQEQYEEAVEHANMAVNLDPYSILNLWFSAPAYNCAEDYETSIANGKRILELNPNMFSGYMWIGLGFYGLGQYDKAIEALKMMVKLNPGPFSLSLLGMNYGVKGERAKAEEIIEKMKEYDMVKTAGNFFMGLVYGAIGESDTAFHYYERAYEYREGQLLWIQYYILRYKPELAKDPRAKQLLEKIGLPPMKY